MNRTEAEVAEKAALHLRADVSAVAPAGVYEVDGSQALHPGHAQRAAMLARWKAGASIAEMEAVLGLPVVRVGGGL